jgi:hypothetical protein
MPVQHMANKDEWRRAHWREEYDQNNQGGACTPPKRVRASESAKK